MAVPMNRQWLQGCSRLFRYTDCNKLITVWLHQNVGTPWNNGIAYIELEAMNYFQENF